MTTSLTTAPAELMRQHAAVLQDYAWRRLVGGQSLSEEDERSRASRLTEFMAIGTSFKLTEKEMVKVVLQGLFDRKARCGCPACRTRS